MIDQAKRLVHHTVGLAVTAACLLGDLRTRGASPGLRRNERGLSQSTEYVILLGGAVVVAGLVILLVRNYIGAHPIPEP